MWRCLLYGIGISFLRKAPPSYLRQNLLRDVKLSRIGLLYLKIFFKAPPDLCRIEDTKFWSDSGRHLVHSFYQMRYGNWKRPILNSTSFLTCLLLVRLQIYSATLANLSPFAPIHLIYRYVLGSRPRYDAFYRSGKQTATVESDILGCQEQVGTSNVGLRSWRIDFIPSDDSLTNFY